MAVSSINTECKRYGCIKNLLACYANCRYNSRCEELKSELTDKTDQATDDINTYLAERGRNPIAIQFLKRGLKFTEQKKSEPPLPRKKTDAKTALISMGKPSASTIALKKLTKKVPMKRKTVMAKKVNRSPKVLSIEQSTDASRVTREAASENAPRPKASVPRQKKRSASTGKSKNNGKVYIILDGKQASLVSERDLMSHLLSSPNSDARYFEAREVEARVQIVLKP